MKRYTVLSVILLAMWMLWLNHSSVVGMEMSLQQEGNEAVIIYDDSLSSDWQNWSWGTTLEFNHNNPIFEGSSAIALSYNEGWAGFYLHAIDLVSLDENDALRFAVHGGVNGGGPVSVALADAYGGIPGPTVTVDVVSGQWTDIELPISDLGGFDTISGIVWQEFSGSPRPEIYVDNITILKTAPPPPSLVR